MLDTAYGHWRDVVLPRTELIVALDYPRLVSLARLLRRALRRVVTRELARNGNRESHGQALSSQSVVARHFRCFSLSGSGSPRDRLTRPLHPSSGCAHQRTTGQWLAAVREHQSARS